MKRMLLTLSLSLLVASGAEAQIARVFLSGTGNDANDCTVQTTPCRSLQGAVDQVPTDGEIVVLNNGGYGGASITKSLTVNVPRGVIAFIARMITVSIGATDKVVLRGLSMNGVIFGDSAGINFSSVGTLVVENSVIAGFSVAGILQSAGGSTLLVNNCEFRNNYDGVGVLNNPTVTMSTATIENCRFENQTFYGVAAAGLTNVNVRNSVFAHNFGGVTAFSAAAGHTASVLVDTCTIAHNSNGVYSQTTTGGSSEIDVSNSTIEDSTVNGVVEDGVSAVVYSYGNNRLRSNAGAVAFTGTIGLS
jgi:Right handed beta helix region